MKNSRSARGFPRAAGGQVTVFLSLILMCTFAVFCVLVESARTAGARWYLQTAANSAMDSVFSQYHRKVWESYRLLFAEYETKEEMEGDFEKFLNPYLEVENWYPMQYLETSTEDMTRVVEQEGRYLEKELLDYMKYGVWNLDFEVETEDLLKQHGKEAEAVKEIAGTYRGHAREAMQLERSLEAIHENLDEQIQLKTEALECLRDYDGSGFRSEASRWVDKLEKIPALVGVYRKRADALALGLEKSREKNQTHHDQCSDSVKQLLEEEILEYQAYVAVDGVRRQEIEGLETWSQGTIRQIESVMEESLEIERIIDEWEEEDEEEGEELDLDALWSPVIRHFEQIDIRTLSFHHGVKDKEKEGWLKQVEQMYQSGMLAMLLPDGREISDKRIWLAEAPSCVEDGAESKRSLSLRDHLLINEYCGQFFSSFCSEKEEDDEGHVLDYEIEYLVGGKSSDEDNLSDALHRILALREGLNLIYILSDREMRAEARTLALAVTGVGAVTPLVMVMTFFIMSVWALGEALMDVRGLLIGKNVPVLKHSEDWHLTLDGLLKMGSSREVAVGGGERGLSYLSWLKIVLFLNPIARQEFRMMDVMQENIRIEQKGFFMRNLVYSLKVKGKLCGKHVFFSPWFVENLLGQRNHQYLMEVRAERSY